MAKDLTILSIEDDPNQVVELNKLVSDFGDTQQAETGKKALQLAGQSPLDIIQVDIGLPDLDGF